MNTEQNMNMGELKALQDFKGKAVVSLVDGKRIGGIEDVLVEPIDLQVKGLVTDKKRIFHSDEMVIPVEEVQLWGEDVVLVRQTDIIRKKEELLGLENCISALDELPGRSVITLSGDRVGALKDVLITPLGALSGLELTKVDDKFKNSLSGWKAEGSDVRLPIAVVHSFGSDAVIVDLANVVAPVQEPVEPATTEEVTPGDQPLP